MPALADFLLSVAPTDFIPKYLKSYIPGETPLSTWPAVTTALASYLAIIFGVREIMKDRPPQQLTTLFRIHNAFLSIGSLILLVLMMEEVGSIWLTSTTYGTMCDETSWTEVRLDLSNPKISALMHNILEIGILLHDQLLFQVYRACGHGVSRPQEETSRYALLYAPSLTH